ISWIMGRIKQNFSIKNCCGSRLLILHIHSASMILGRLIFHKNVFPSVILNAKCRSFTEISLLPWSTKLLEIMHSLVRNYTWNSWKRNLIQLAMVIELMRSEINLILMGSKKNMNGSFMDTSKDIVTTLLAMIKLIDSSQYRTHLVVQQLSTVNNPECKIFCADFSSLFTNLPHDVVKDKLFCLFDLLFRNAGSEYIVVQGRNVRYDRNNSSIAGRSYHKNDLKLIVDFILQNSFAYYGGRLYQQNRGIPQGNNASPQIADLTLAVMEFQHIRNNVGIGHPLSFSLNRTFRYIDDLFHISDKADEFVRLTSDMYHHSLTLEQTNSEPTEAAFLDLSVRVTQSGHIQTSLYNKTDDYSFSVIRYPHFESNIPISMGLNTMHGEIVRIYRNCSSFNHFLERVRLIARYFISIKYPKEIVFSRVYSTLNRNPNVSLKYGLPNSEICLRVTNKL
ncbi:hypothetical protein PENTCL1PPCAC_26318, partial [Pristionchus entomophagus]